MLTYPTLLIPRRVSLLTNVLLIYVLRFIRVLLCCRKAIFFCFFLNSEIGVLQALKMKGERTVNSVGGCVVIVSIKN